MSTPAPDQQPTSVLPQQTAEQPAVSTAPATRRARLWAHVPARVGRARTSTLVIGCLFVLLMALNAALPREDTGTTNVVLPSGQTVPVRNADLPDDYVPPTTPAAPAPGTTPAPATSAPASSSRAPRTTEDAPASSTAPATTSRAPSPSSTPSSTAPRASSSSRAPSSSAEPSPLEDPEESSSAPTS